jgi:transcriptional regulator of acetoin/glycerol metabolism
LNRATLRRARELFLEGRELPRHYEINARLAHSWRRSAQAGLTPEGRLPDPIRLDTQQLACAAERKMSFIQHAKPVLEFLHSQTSETGSMVILADECGVILQTLGDTEFLDRASRVALAPGTSWSESHRGTNGIGTALAESRPLTVLGGEHFLERNGFLSCAAAPVMAPDGQLKGVIDISCDERRHCSHTLGLVRTAALTLENRLFASRFGRTLHVRFHPQAEGIGTFAEGAIALSEDGWILGANSSGLVQLGLTPADLGVTPLSRVLQIRFEDLLALSRRQPDAPCLVALHDKRKVFVRVIAARGSLVAAPATLPAAPRDALTTLDTGDEAVSAAIDKARKLLGKPVALLLQGESGTGKRRFAQAMHASAPHPERPFITIHCAARTESQLEAELFGAPFSTGQAQPPAGLLQARGGTLLIEQIQCLPMSMQVRLGHLLRDKQLMLPGGETAKLDFTLICTVRQDLKPYVEAGQFSEAFYYAISGMTLRCPPLRARKDFVLILASTLEALAPGRPLSLEPGLAAALANHDWPGNMHQLTSVLQAICALLDPEDSRIGWQHLPDPLRETLHPNPAPPSISIDIAENLRTLSAETMTRAVAACNGNMSEASRRLGISRSTLYRHLRTNGLHPAEEHTA